MKFLLKKEFTFFKVKFRNVWWRRTRKVITRIKGVKEYNNEVRSKFIIRTIYYYRINWLIFWWTEKWKVIKKIVQKFHPSRNFFCLKRFARGILLNQNCCKVVVHLLLCYIEWKKFKNSVVGELFPILWYGKFL